MTTQRSFFYGWILVGVLWVCYGFGISPAYYSWGAFASSLIKDLDLDRERMGAVFGLFTFLYSGVGPLVGISMSRIGIRATITGGFLMSALGLFMMSRADSLMDCFISFSILGGAGIGFATIVPSQTLAQNWFLKRRALAIGLIFTAGGIVGKIVARYDAYMLENYDWRTGWVVISGVSLALAVIAALFIRDTPESIGQHRDGEKPYTDPASGDAPAAHAETAAVDRWTAFQAMKTPQFFLLIMCGIAYAVPWGTTIPHMALHFQDIGYERAVAVSFVGTMALISIAGRLAGALGDHIPPQVVLAVSLVIEGLGCGGLLLADTKPIAYLSIAMIGLGFGTAYISIPVVFSHFFGRQAFGLTSGVRILFTGIFNALGPWIAGRIYDAEKSYTVPFMGLLVLSLIGAFCATILRRPKPPAA